MSSDVPRARPGLPDVDDRLAAPGTPYEVHDGELVAVSPADEAHASRHSKIQAIIEMHVAVEFDVACDMLTRLTKVDDKAPDVSVFPIARDPNGRRQIEQLAFEVVSTQDLGRAGTKAAQLVARGVRRVFAIDVERSRALEWSAALGTWSMLDPAGHIEDTALDVPVSIDALVHAAKADDAVARATRQAQPGVRGSRRGARGKGPRQGKAEGLAKAVLAVLAARNVVVEDVARACILDEQDLGQLEYWVGRAMTCTTVAELFAPP